MELHNITKLNSAHKSKKRVGRGGGSGKGWHTTGRGQKGQKSRGGYNIPFGFEGGQVPLYKKMPHIGGFKSLRKVAILSLSLNALNVFEDNQEVSRNSLIEAGIINRSVKSKVKILGSGDLKKKLILKGFMFSASARKKAEKAGAQFLDA